MPTVPGAWLIFANGAVYHVYDIPQRLWGISVTSDQQAAGAIMKLVGGTYLWVLDAIIFFTWAGRHEEASRRGVEYTERRSSPGTPSRPSSRPPRLRWNP